MRTTVAAAVAALALGLAGCSDSGQPSPPPTPDQPTTTSSPADTAPTTEAAPPTTESPSETASTDLPPEATEDSEAGAEAFVQAYLEAYNALGKEPRSEVLSKFARDDCETCANLEASIDQLANSGHHASGPSVEIHDVSAVNLGETTRVEAHLEQLGGQLLDEQDQVIQAADGGGEFVYVFTVSREGGQWLVDEILIQE